MALLKKETEAERQRRSRERALERSGGPNAPMTELERSFNRDTAELFQDQYNDAVETEIWVNADFARYQAEPWIAAFALMASGYLGIKVARQGKTEADLLQIAMADFIERPAVVAAIRDESLLFAEALGKSTTEAIRMQLIQAIEAGESIPEIKKRLQTVFGFVGDERKESWRAERVARTEIARAATIGQKEYWRQTGVVEATVWDASNDACPFCLEMHGKAVSLKETYFTKGDELTVDFNGKDITMGFNYADVPGPPLHPNCRCSLVAQLAEMVGQ